jgi:hypothetical protein
MWQGDRAVAHSFYEQSLARSAEDWVSAAASLCYLGNIDRYQGDLAQASARLEESLRIAQDVNEPWGIANALYYMATLACSQGDGVNARSLGAEALAIRRKLGFNRGIAECLEVLAWAAGVEGAFVRAVRLFAAAEALRGATGLGPVPPAERGDHAGWIAAARAALGEAAFAAAWAADRALSLDAACELALAES